MIVLNLCIVHQTTRGPSETTALGVNLIFVSHQLCNQAAVREGVMVEAGRVL